MFFCKKCGAQLEDGTDFCNACGATVEKESKNASTNNSKNHSSSNALTKSDDGKILAGVCAGMSKKWNLNPWIFRVLFLFVPSGVLIYIVLACLLKKEDN